MYLFIFLINITTFGYSIDALLTNYKNAEYKGISTQTTEGYLKNTLPKDYEAIQWIKENIDRDKVILEATKVGGSYSNYSRISTFTGNPTVLGWMNHEWVWRYEKDSLPVFYIITISQESNKKNKWTNNMGT